MPALRLRTPKGCGSPAPPIPLHPARRMRHLRPTAFLPLLLLAGPLATAAAAQIDYSVAFDRDTRIWSVEGRVANPGSESIDYWFPRWTAGAYHLADYGRFVDGFTATDGAGNPLEVNRVDDSLFEIASEGMSEVVVRYQAAAISTSTFSNEIIDVESNRITKDYAYVNPVSLFGFVPETIDEPVTLQVSLPEGWKTGTVLEQNEAGAYVAPSYYRFEDSPLFFSPELITVELEAAGKPLVVSVHGRGARETEEVVEGCRNIVDAAADLMGGVPYDRYHFLIGFVPESQGGSGLEHSYSTLILTNDQNPISWSIIAHEFFHLWCAERIHVEAVHRPDYTRPLETGTIWVNEGITEYFTHHVLLHAGFMSEDEFLRSLGGPAPRLPGSDGSGPSWTEISRRASNWESMNDLMLFAMKMYMQGPRTVFALDLAMRDASEGERGILDLLHHLQAEYVEKDRGFVEGEMISIVNEVAGSDLTGFYEKYIDGPENPNVGEYLHVLGYALVDGKVVSLDAPTPEQLEARADFFSVEGRP